jgi:molecular chaperone GrpE
MTQENQEPQESQNSVGGEVPESEAHESEEQSSDSVAQDDELTVDDILSAEQTEEAAGEDESNEYLEDLRRISAEFANYRKRTEDNRELERQRATATAVASLLPVLDDLDRAEKHGDLDEGSPFHTIAQKLRTSMEKLGLTSFGEEGEDFDPNRHEAISQVPTPGMETAKVLEVFERGYKVGDVELRAAKVIVAVPADG